MLGADRARVWQVRQFYTAPTLVRSLEAQDDKFVTQHDRSSLRILGTVGEPINPRAWMWFFEVGLILPADSLSTLPEVHVACDCDLRGHCAKNLQLPSH